jgi:hypothetical protein
MADLSRSIGALALTITGATPMNRDAPPRSFLKPGPCVAKGFREKSVDSSQIRPEFLQNSCRFAENVRNLVENVRFFSGTLSLFCLFSCTFRL